MNQRLLSSITQGLALLPIFVSSIETLFGKHKGKGQDKKQAVTNLVNASIIGSAVGFSAVKEDASAQALLTIQPAISSAIDSIVALNNQMGWPSQPTTPDVSAAAASPTAVAVTATAPVSAPTPAVMADKGFQH